ncbi:hypothetical protein BGX34_005473 [Mortierella sp. NVP85]|nr:hypothetical protein BGX34_005473 [Mortierella sp. NVP85]
MSDSIDFESEDEQGFGNNSRRQRYLGKRRAREPDDFEVDQVEDFDEHEIDADEERVQAGGSRTIGSSSSRRVHDPIDSGHHDDEEKPTFRPETMGAIFKEVWREPGVKVQKEALQLSAEYLRLFTIEALHRTAAYQREQEDEELKNEESLIELDSLEAITPQLVLDF